MGRNGAAGVLLLICKGWEQPFFIGICPAHSSSAVTGWFDNFFGYFIQKFRNENPVEPVSTHFLFSHKSELNQVLYGSPCNRSCRLPVGDPGISQNVFIVSAVNYQHEQKNLPKRSYFQRWTEPRESGISLLEEALKKSGSCGAPQAGAP